MPPPTPEQIMNLVSADSSRPVPFHWAGKDGCKLAGEYWPPCRPDTIATAALPVLCLPGLSRNTRDFHDVAFFLQARGHPVFALDYRGRGKSDWDPDWQNYAIPVEAEDISAAIDFLELQQFALLGTSRGGLHGLVMSARYPAERMRAVIFNDIGPHVELSGLRRIAGSIGRVMRQPTLEGFATLLKDSLKSQFPAFGDTDWLKLAGQLASPKEGAFELDYDPELARQLDRLDDVLFPDLWPLYTQLADRPVLVLRGAHSDILDEETFRRMGAEHPGARLHTIAGQGHAPVLWEAETHQLIADFLG